MRNTDKNLSIEQEYIEKMISQQVGGIILISSILDEQKVNKLSELKIPFVLCDRFLTDTPFDTVSIDNYKASYEAVLHFIRKGHQNICHLSGPSFVQSAKMRRRRIATPCKNIILNPAFGLETSVMSLVISL